MMFRSVCFTVALVALAAIAITADSARKWTESVVCLILCVCLKLLNAITTVLFIFPNFHQHNSTSSAQLITHQQHCIIRITTSVSIEKLFSTSTALPDSRRYNIQYTGTHNQLITIKTGSETEGQQQTLTNLYKQRHQL